MTGPGQTEAITIATDDGVELEAELAVATGQRALAVVCHPHPQYGGNMYNNVVGTLFNTLPTLGVTTLRFNFRGVGRSTGDHDNGEGERGDITGAVRELKSRYQAEPLILCGYSFGADIALSVTDADVAGWFLVAPPLRVIPIAQMGAASDPRPKCLVTGTDDDFNPAVELRAAVDQWPDHRVVAIDGANHFFTTGLEQVADAATDFCNEIVS